MKRQGGFTMVELIMVMVMVGVLAAIGIPKLMGGNTTGALVFGDQVASALRHAQKSAVAHRRLVCMELTARTVVVRIRTADTVPAAGSGVAACDAALKSVDGGMYDSSDPTVAMKNQPAQLYFQPDGTISSAPAGTPLASGSFAIELDKLPQRTIMYAGSTGYVE